ncbi:MAG: DUF1990 domain-containing protein [Deltaproteobacteria bacterium]|nr:DUF1990 domain-containing protein [Deltaproteobacteria bacterium]
MDILVVRRPRLDRWRDRPFVDVTRTGREHEDVYERDVGTEPPGGPGPVFRTVQTSILRYSIFPPSLVAGVLDREPVAVGDAVGVHFVRFRIVRLFFAARVTDVFDRVDGDWARAGFTYRTLVGHPELGEETFSVEKHLATGRVRVALRSWSRPGTRLARLFAPIVRAMQVDASRRALDHLAAVARDPSATPS